MLLFEQQHGETSFRDVPSVTSVEEQGRELGLVGLVSSHGLTHVTHRCFTAEYTANTPPFDVRIHMHTYMHTHIYVSHTHIDICALAYKKSAVIQRTATNNIEAINLTKRRVVGTKEVCHAYVQNMYNPFQTVAKIRNMCSRSPEHYQEELKRGS